MAKTNIIFNDTNYSIDESSLAPGMEQLKSHLSTAMNGSGATINLDGTAYDVDSTKLSTTTNAFTSYLGTIAGSGMKVVVNGVEYSIDSAKVSDAISDLETVLDNLSNPQPVALAAGLYETGTDVMTKSWDELVADGAVSVTNGAVSKGSNKNLLVGDLVLPDSVTSIGNSAFSSCRNLTNIVMSDSVTSIGSTAFHSCKNLTSITIPESVTSIGSNAFTACDNLTAVYITDIASWCNISFNINAGNPLCSAKNLYLNGELVSDLVIPDSVTSIGDCAFYDCTSLTSITIPESVTSIGDMAFSDCPKLVEVINHSSLNIVAGSSDYGSVAKNAKEVHTGESKIVNKDDYLFYTYNGVNYLIGYAGENTKLTLPESYNGGNYELHKFAFANYPITEVTIPGSLISIVNNAFDGCDSLTSITIPDSVTSIGEYAFRETGLTEIIIPKGVTSISTGMFYDCPQLESVTIPDSVTSIGNSAFRNCTDLKTVTIGNNVRSISEYAFCNCTSLTSITIPESVTSIGSTAFTACSKVVEVINHSSLNIVAGSTAFGEVARYAKEVHTGESKIVNKDDYLFYTYDGVNYLLAYAGKEKNLTLPESYNGGNYELHKFAFANYPITEVNLPDSVTSIGERAFYDCADLKTVTLGNGVTSIGERAFSSCRTLTSLTLTDSVTSIGDYAFYECDSLASVTIPYNVTSIGKYAFRDCTNLNSITFTGTKARWNSIKLGNGWRSNVPAKYVQCSNGQVKI